MASWSSCHLWTLLPAPVPLGHSDPACQLVWNGPPWAACLRRGGGAVLAAALPRLTVSLAPQANVEHMTEKMQTEIQRGLVLR